MTLRALLCGESVQSFYYSEEQWTELKQTYKSKSLMMPCCQRNAIPKTSKLGVFYFAHARRGECTSQPETQEHLKLKSLVALAAKQSGWDVVTEQEGETPDGEKWIADVFCQKGAAKVAIEVQWSQQSEDEYKRRTDKYTCSGVRCAWLSRLHARREVSSSSMPDNGAMPRFGVRMLDGEFVIPRYEQSVSSFVSGMLSGKLKWFPRAGDLVEVRVCYMPDNCWRCKQSTNLVTSLDFYYANGGYITSLPFNDSSAAEWVFNHVPKRELWDRRIGTVRRRFSKKAGGEYMANGCAHCDALQGNFFLHDMLDLDGEALFISKSWVFVPSEINIEPCWRFDGKKGLYFY